MEDTNQIELLYDVIDSSISFLYERTKKKYFDLFFLSCKCILDGEVDLDLPKEDISSLEEIFEPIKNIDINVEMIRKALQAHILRGFKEQKLSNSAMTPDTIGILFSYLISKFDQKEKNLKLLDPIAGVGNLIFTITNHLTHDLKLYAVEHNELYVNILKNSADMLNQNVDIYFQNTLNTMFTNMDYVVCDFDEYDIHEGKYFPYECIKHHINSLKDEGIMMCVIPNDFFEFDSSQEFKKEISKTCSIIGLLELPDSMFSGSAKSIILIQKKIIENKKCLMVKLPSFNDSNAFGKALNQIEAWFENNINKK